MSSLQCGTSVLTDNLQINNFAEGNCVDKAAGE